MEKFCKYCFDPIKTDKYKLIVGSESFTVYKQCICKNCGKKNFIPLNIKIKLHDNQTVCPYCFSKNVYLKPNTIFIDKNNNFIGYKIRCRKCNRQHTQREKIIENDTFIIEGTKIEELYDE